MQAKESSEMNYAIECIRIMATVMIVFHHYQQFTGVRFKYFNFYGGSFYFGLMVECFFVMSGYFTYKYASRIQGGGICLRNFILKKAVRLLPMTAFATFVMQANACIYLQVYNGAEFGPVDVEKIVSLWKWIIASLGIESGWAVQGANFVTWYVSVLMLCYVIFYAVAYSAKYIKIPQAYCYIFIVLAGIGIVEYNINLPFFNNQSARGYYAFFWGLLLAKYMKNIQACKWMKLGSCPAALYIILAQFFTVAKFMLWDREAYIVAFILCPALLIIAESEWMKYNIKGRIIEILGKSSFCVYVLHMPMLLLLYILTGILELPVNVLTLECMAGFTFAVYIIGIMAYYFIERNISRALYARLETAVKAADAD